MIGDELARWPATSEGSPVDLVVERAEAFRATRRIVFASTPVTAADHAWQWLRAGDVNLWHAPCPSCGVWWSPEWADVQTRPGAVRLSVVLGGRG